MDQKYFNAIKSAIIMLLCVIIATQIELGLLQAVFLIASGLFFVVLMVEIWMI